MAGRAQQALSAQEADRGPVLGGSPPKQRQRLEDDDEELKEEGIDPSQWGLARFFKKQVHIGVSEAIEKLEGKIDKKFEAKLTALAGASDDIEKKFDKEMAESRTWQTGMESKLTSLSAKVVEGLADINRQFPTLSSAPPTKEGQGVGKRFGGKVIDQEKRARTVTFRKFPEDTKAADIKSFIEEVLENEKDNIEEVYAFGKKHADGGAARFKTESAMWNHMTKNAGHHKHNFKGTPVYCNVDGRHNQAGEDEDKDKGKVRAIRKVVRVIIEQNGGDGPSVKKDIDANYPRGFVLFREERVAEWNEKESKMILKGSGMQYESEFKKLLGLE